MRSARTAGVASMLLAAALVLGGLARPASAVTRGPGVVHAGDIVFVKQGALTGNPATSRPAILAIRRADGTISNLVTLPAADNQVNPAVSPDGTRIAFDSTLSGRQAYELYVINSDGTNLTEVTTSPADNTAAASRFTDWMPSWCGNERLVFQRQYSGNPLRPDQPTRPEIWMVRADGSAQVKISRHDSKDYLDPACSPDGTKIAFARYDTLTGEFQVWYMNSNGTGETLIPHQPPGSDEPAWASNGRLCVHSQVQVTGNIYCIDINGSRRTQVTHNTYQDAEYPTVSADGSVIAYYQLPGDDLWQVSADGTGAPRRLTSGSHVAYVNPAYVTTTWPNAATRNLVGLGDSVAAGEGINYGFAWNGTNWVQQGLTDPAWTDTTKALGADYQDCHQSGSGYPSLIAANGGNYRVFNMACTGATALQNNGLENGGVLDREIFGDGTSPPAQLGGHCTGCDPPSTIFSGHDPAIVTLTLGADDIDFSNWIITCYNPLLGACNTKTNTSTLTSQLGLEKTDLATVLRQLNDWAQGKSKTLRVLVTTYYNPFNPNETNCIDYHGPVGVGITSGELSWLERGLSTLNANIAADVTNAHSADTYLKVTLVNLGGVMAGHEFCSAHPWVYGPSIDFNVSGVLNPNPAPFHPTPAGQHAIYLAVKAALP